MTGRVAGIIGLGLVVVAAAFGVWWVAARIGGLPQLSSTLNPLRQPQTSQLAAQRYLKAWEERRFDDMHALFTPEAQTTTPRDEFVERMKAVHAEATIDTITGSLGTVTPLHTGEDPEGLLHEQTKLSLSITTAAVGEFKEEVILNTLKDSEDNWRIAWTPDALFRDLAGNRLVRLFLDKPQRGDIVDRQGTPLAEASASLTVGVVPAWMGDREQTVQLLATVLSLDPNFIKQQTDAVQPDWYVHLRSVPASRRAELTEKFAAAAGVIVREQETRSYPGGALAANVVGYVSAQTAAEAAAPAQGGAVVRERVGRTGIEGWGDQHLAGTAGARLTIITTDGQVVRTIKEQPVKHGGDIALSLDANVQRIAEDILGSRTGSIVVMDPRDNSLLAVATGPTFDPNGFVRGWSDAEWQQLNNDPRHPFQNRPAVSTYPSGSVFKPITMAAGLERGGYAPTSRFNCNGRWTGLPGITFGDWKPNGHGILDLSSGMAQSCDIVFYDVAKKLDAMDAKILPQFARGFGLGAPTGVVGMEEVAGTVPDHDWKMKALDQAWFSGDSVNLGIGQGYLETTPLQIANAYSAIARGALKTPLLVWRTLDSDGQTVKEYAAEDRGALPVSGATLAAIRTALQRVAGSPEGTAFSVFHGFRAPVAAKSGTAENQNIDPDKTHAWFVAYAPADAPQVLVTVMLEGGGMGGANAAPVARQVLEATLK